MAENEYTPTVGMAASRYSAGRLALDPEASRIAPSERDAEFDRMLAQVRAGAVEAAGLRRQVEGSFVEAMRRARAEAKAEGVDAAADELVRRNQFSERTLDILTDLAAAIRTTPTETTNGGSDEL